MWKFCWMRNEDFACQSSDIDRLFLSLPNDSGLDCCLHSLPNDAEQEPPDEDEGSRYEQGQQHKDGWDAAPF